MSSEKSGFLGWLGNVLKRNSELGSMFDLDLTYETVQRLYLKSYALNTNINFISRTISQADFRILKNGKKQLNDWYYLLNIRPNKNQSSADFWEEFVYKLIYDNEVLVILTDDNNLLIADDFDRDEFAVYSDVFRNVTVKDYTFRRTFSMDEVWHLEYSNEKLTKFMNGMLDDYANLFSRLLEISLRNYQIRGTVSLDTTQSLNRENLKKLQDFIDKLFNSFTKKSVALVPKLKGFEYDEMANGDKSGPSIDELNKLKRSLVDDIAGILGIPSALVHGELSDYETAIKAYIKFCIGPLVEKIEDELKAKILTKEEVLAGHTIQVGGIKEKDPLEVAQAIDKIVASGTYSRNEVREMLGDERSDNPALDEYLITKNYQSVEGGETSEKDD